MFSLCLNILFCRIFGYADSAAIRSNQVHLLSNLGQHKKSLLALDQFPPNGFSPLPSLVRHAGKRLAFRTFAVDSAYYALERRAQHGQGAKVSAHSLNAVLYACLVRGDAERAAATFAEFGQLGVSPDTFSYNTMLEVLGKEGSNDHNKRLAAALRMEMGEADVSRDAGTYAALAKSKAARHRGIDAKGLVDKARGEGIKLYADTYARLAAEAAVADKRRRQNREKAGELEAEAEEETEGDGEQILQMMEGDGYEVNDALRRRVRILAGSERE